MEEYVNEDLKDQFIIELIRINNNHAVEYKKYLEEFSEEELDKMISNYYLYDIKNDQK